MSGWRLAKSSPERTMVNPTEPLGPTGTSFGWAERNGSRPRTDDATIARETPTALYAFFAVRLRRRAAKAADPPRTSNDSVPGSGTGWGSGGGGGGSFSPGK